MAYVPNNLGIIVHAIGGTGIRLISYRTDDPKEDLLTVGYFEDAREKGLRRSDMVFVTAINGVEEPYALVIETIEADGSGTAILSAADTALQLSDVADVAISGDYNDLLNLPTLGTAAAQDISYFALAAQAVPAGGTTGQVLTRGSNTPGDWTWTTNRDGDMLASVYDPQTIAEDAFDATTRSVLVARIGGGWVPKNGRVYRAAGIAYVGTTGATAISDLPGLLPHGDVFVQHFGIVADLAYEEQQARDNTGTLISGQYGFVRTGGTDWAATLIVANNYAASVGRPLLFKNGGYYWKGELEATTSWVPETDGGVTLWAEYAKRAQGALTISESGLVVKTSGVNIGIPGKLGFKCVAQFALQTSITGAKEAGNGQRGSFIRWNEYYNPAAQPIIDGCGCRLWIVRALLQRDNAGAIIATARSVSSIVAFGTAGLKNFDFEFGVWGRTNVSSQYLFIAHWGCYYDPSTTPFDDATTYDKTPATPIETYHATHGEARFISDIDNANGYGLSGPFEIASGGYIDVYGTHTNGLGSNSAYSGAVGVVSCGDLCNAFTVAEQRPFVGGPIRVFDMVATEVNGVAGSQQAYVKGLGTSKAIGDYEPGTSIFKQRQLRMHVEWINCKVSFASGSDPVNQRGLFVDQVVGTVLFPNFRTEGGQRGVEVEYSRGLFEGSLSGDGVAINNFSDIVVFNDVTVDRGNTANTADTSNYASGYNSTNSRAIEVVSTYTDIGTVSGAVAIGGTTLAFASGVSQRVNQGDIFFVGSNRLTVRGAAAAGALSVAVSPILTALVGDETVTHYRAARSIIRRPAFASSARGIRVIDSQVEIEDLGGILYTGYNAVHATGTSHVLVRGGTLPFVGRSSTDITNRRTFRLENTSKLVLDGVRAGNNPAITTHIQYLDSSSVEVSNCQIEAPNSFMTITGSWDKTTWNNNVDWTGARVRHPGLSETALPELLIGGTHVGDANYSAREGTIYYGANGAIDWIFDFTLSSLNSLTGTLSINLPKSWSSLHDVISVVSIQPATLTTYALALQGNAGSTFTFQRQSTSGVASLDHAQITATSRFRAHVRFYRT